MHVLLVDFYILFYQYKSLAKINILYVHMIDFSSQYIENEIKMKLNVPRRQISEQ